MRQRLPGGAVVAAKYVVLGFICSGAIILALEPSGYNNK